MDCPHQEKIEESNVTVHITLLTGTKSTLAETLGKGILDSACTKTVAGVAWMEEFIHNLSDKECKDVDKSETPGNSVFRFGDGVESRSLRCVTIPVNFGNKCRKMDVEVVKNDIPLLISKPAMSSMRMKIDFAKHVAFIENEKFKLTCI